jgi:hypothetical protein
MLGYIEEVGTTYKYYYPTNGSSLYTSMLYTDMVNGTSGVQGFAKGWMRNTYFSQPSDSYLHAYCYAYAP